MVLASRRGYTKALFGIYTGKLWAENRINELKSSRLDLEVFEIEEIQLNTEIEVDF